MKGIKVLAVLIGVSTVITVSAQKKKPQTKAFITDPVTGVQYRFIKHDKTGAKPQEGNYGNIIMTWNGKTMKGDADSIFLDTRKRGGDSNGVIPLKLVKSFKGCLEQGILMMAKGDSAVIRVNGDSLFLKTFRCAPDKLPPFVTQTTWYTFNVKLVNFMTEAEMNASKQAEIQKR